MMKPTKLFQFFISGIFYFVSLVIFAQENTKSFHIPSTISNEAKEILKGWNNQDNNIDTAGFPKGNASAAEWVKIQNEFEKIAAKSIPAIVKKYQPVIDTIFIGGVRAIDIHPKNYKKSDKLIIYIHGGAYTFYPADVNLASSVPLAVASGLRIISIDYTLAPHAKFNEITDEVLNFYKGILKEYKPKNIAVYGDSAGGGLAAGAILKMRDRNIALPGVLVLWSPWTDIDQIGDTYYTLRDSDPKLVYDGILENCALAYAPRNEWKNPYVSPVYGDFSKDFPPTLIQVGGKEIFLSNSIRMYRTLNENNKEVVLDVYEGMWHVWQGSYNIPESKAAVNNTKNFIFKYLGIEPKQ